MENDEALWQEALAGYKAAVAREAELEAALAEVRETKALTVAALYGVGLKMGRTQDDVAAAIGVKRQRVGQHITTAGDVLAARAGRRSGENLEGCRP